MKFLLRQDLNERGHLRLPGKPGGAFTNKHLLELEAKGKFPRRVRLGVKTPAWPEPEVDEYERTLLAERSAEKAA